MTSSGSAACSNATTFCEPAFRMTLEEPMAVGYWHNPKIYISAKNKRQLQNILTFN